MKTAYSVKFIDSNFTKLFKTWTKFIQKTVLITRSNSKNEESSSVPRTYKMVCGNQ